VCGKISRSRYGILQTRRTTSWAEYFSTRCHERPTCDTIAEERYRHTARHTGKYRLCEIVEDVRHSRLPRLAMILRNSSPEKIYWSYASHDIEILPQRGWLPATDWTTTGRKRQRASTLRVLQMQKRDVLQSSGEGTISYLFLHI